MFNRFRYWFQYSKRQNLINRYGFYETCETQTGIMIGEGSFIGNYTTFHLHTKVDLSVSNPTPQQR